MARPSLSGVDLSALIFVALAIAWAVYLIPKALKHHEIDRVSRSVESFSDRVRVLARREPVSATKASLVVGRSGTTQAAEADGGGRRERARTAPTPAQLRARKLAAARAARRRRRVLGTILSSPRRRRRARRDRRHRLGMGCDPGHAPRGLARRLPTDGPQRARGPARRTAPVRKRRTTLADQVIAEEDAGDNTEEIPAVRADVAEIPADPDGWDPVPVTLPTYVGKAAAGRTVRTIDLDSTGVWSSGRNEADSALAREADEQRAEQRRAPTQRRVSGA